MRDEGLDLKTGNLLIDIDEPRQDLCAAFNL